MKTIRIFLTIFTLLSIMNACEKDGDKIYLSSLDENELVATQDEVILTSDISGQVVLSLAWTNTSLSVSHPNMDAPNIISTYIQVSTENDFSSNMTESLELNTSRAYTGTELNNLVLGLEAEPEIVDTYYFRLKSSVGNNMEPVYSNVLSIDITPYSADVIEYIYLPGIDDGISGGWNFNRYLSIYNESAQAYAGVVDVNSLWGYQISIEKDSWDNPYKFGTGDALAGTLELNSDTNIPAPPAGVYLIDVDMKKLQYKLTALSNTIYVVGLDDNWAFDVPLTMTATPGIYSGTISFNGASPWGFQIQLDTTWNRYYGGSNGKLIYKGDNITDDATWAPGTYTMVVDFVNGTYTLNP